MEIWMTEKKIVYTADPSPHKTVQCYEHVHHERATELYTKAYEEIKAGQTKPCKDYENWNMHEQMLYEASRLQFLAKRIAQEAR
jgi:hypothetical protein